MVGIVGDTTAEVSMVIMVDTIEDSMGEVFTPFGDYMDGELGDGLFWDGPMQVGPTTNMEDIHI
jgi:hypothetical protein